MPEQSEQDDYWDRYAQQPKQDSSAHIFLPLHERTAPVIPAFGVPTACRRGQPASIDRSLLLYCFLNGVFGAAHHILHLPCSFLRGAFGLGLRVAGDPTDSLLDGALYLTSGAHDAIFVDGYFLDCAH